MFEKFSTNLLKTVREGLVRDLANPEFKVDREAIHHSLERLDSVILSRLPKDCERCAGSMSLRHEVCVYLYGEKV
jgi:hypothetical protein